MPVPIGLDELFSIDIIEMPGLNAFFDQLAGVVDTTVKGITQFKS